MLEPTQATWDQHTHTVCFQNNFFYTSRPTITNTLGTYIALHCQHCQYHQLHAHAINKNTCNHVCKNSLENRKLHMQQSQHWRPFNLGYDARYKYRLLWPTLPHSRQTHTVHTHEWTTNTQVTPVSKSANTYVFQGEIWAKSFWLFTDFVGLSYI